MKLDESAQMREVAIRCYCHGFGDCFLITFDPDTKPFHVVIDCGILLNSPDEADRMREVVDDLFAATGGAIDVLAVTHEHYDHLCGFNHASDTWQKFNIGEVWMAWTENPHDAFARSISKEKDDIDTNLRAAFRSMRPMSDSGQRVQSLLAFSENTRKARDFVVGLAKANGKDPVYWEPGKKAAVGDRNVEALFLGPPKDKAMLRKTETDSKQVRLNMAFALDTAIEIGAAPVDYEDHIRRALGLSRPSRKPAFDPLYESDAPDPLFSSQENAWRRIDYSSGERAVETLAIQLDKLTNNTSLAIAFRLKSGKILLFPGDAQGGNWLSWQMQETVFGPIEALMERTVFYKVGHHGSHNGTFLAGRYDSISKDAAIFMPFERTAKWPSIPFQPLITRFTEHGTFVASQDAAKIPAGSEKLGEFESGPPSEITKRPRWVEWSC